MEAQLITTDRLAHVPEHVRQIISQVKCDLRNHYGDNLHQLVLFGSYARGDFHDESDIDLMPLLLNSSRSMWQEKATLFDLSYSYFERTYLKVSILPVSLTEYETSTKFLFRFIHKDGILV